MCIRDRLLLLVLLVLLLGVPHCTFLMVVVRSCVRTSRRMSPSSS